MDEENLFKILILYFFFFFFFKAFQVSLGSACRKSGYYQRIKQQKILEQFSSSVKGFFFSKNSWGQDTSEVLMGHMLNVIVFSIFLSLVNIIRNLFCVSKKKKKQKEKPQFKNVYFLFFIHIQAKLKYRLREDINCWREILYCRDGSLCNLIRISCALRVNNNNNIYKITQKLSRNK